MFFNEAATGFYFISHEDGEETVCFYRIGQFYFQHDALFWIHGGIPELFWVHFTKPFVTLNRTTIATNFIEQFILFIIVIGVIFLTTFTYLVQRRLGNEYVAFCHQWFHIAIEEGQKQSTNMSPIYIGIGHDDNFIIPKFGDIEIFAYTGTKSGNHGANGIRIEYPIQTSFFYVQNLTTKRKNGLVTTITARFCRTTCGVPFDDVDFSHLRIFFCAISQFSRKAGYFQRIFTTGQFTSTTSRFTSTAGGNAFFYNGFPFGRMFFQVGTKSFGYDIIHNALDFQVAQLGFGLTFKLRIWHFDRNNASEPFTDIIAGQVGIIVF